MSTFVERLKDEHDGLEVNLEKLKVFIDSPSFNDFVIDEEKGLLRQQAEVMTMYKSILAARLLIHS